MNQLKKLAKKIDNRMAAVVAILLIGAFFTGRAIYFTAYQHNHPARTNTHLDNLPPRASKPTPHATQSPLVSQPHPKYAAPILMYHYVRVVDPVKDKLGYNLSVAPTEFDAQLKWLSDNGYQTVSLTDLCTNDVSSVTKPVVLTFDDGYADMYTDALPILQKYNFTGTFFIIKDDVGKSNYMDQTQITTMQTAGMEIGSHTVNHIDLATATIQKQQFEINQSKQNAMVFAYPSGKYSAQTIKIVNDAGYYCAVTTNAGIANTKSSVFELPRVRISGGESLENYIKSIKGERL